MLSWSRFEPVWFSKEEQQLRHVPQSLCENEIVDFTENYDLSEWLNQMEYAKSWSVVITKQLKIKENFA